MGRHSRSVRGGCSREAQIRVGSIHLIEYKTGRLRTLILFKYSKLSNMIFGHVSNFMHPFRTELSELCG
ncbi:hypothetical protein EMIT0P253_10538 [Pseudomonas sp. IT-P253]